MRFQMLGPLRVWDGSAWSAIGAAHQRVVLAVLLAEAGRPVSVDRLVDEIWGEQPPRTARHAVQVYVRRLRQLLGDGAEGNGGRLVTRGQAYQLNTGEDDLDAATFERLVEAGTRRLSGGELERGAAELAEALALWRGPVLSDVPAGPAVTAEVARLDRRRLTAIEERLHALLELGRHAGVVDELQRLVEQHPLRERLYGQLMLALLRSGRRGEALAAYRQARRLLVSELGVEPGADLQRLHRAILAGGAGQASEESQALAGTASTAGTITPAAPIRAGGQVPPAQLPADVSGFVGRDEQLDRLDRLLARAGAQAAAGLVIATVVGVAGAGKTALAVRWAHRVRDAFPDGQLYVNLRGYAAGPPLRPIDALAGFLPALGLPADQVPDDLEQAAAAYRSLLAGRRVLVLLDNAHHADQVRPLLPGGAGCLVVVTSRDRLHGLVARDGAAQIDLSVLPPAAARRLLAELVGEARVRAEPGAAAELVDLCGRLPLALRIAAAGLTGRPAVRIGDYTRQLATGDRLSTLEIDGDPDVGVRTAFDHSYSRLPPAARAMFRLLGLVPGPDVAAPAAAALAGLPPEAARRLLDRLAAAHLVTEHAPGRYTMHDLIRLYARQRASEQDAEPDRAAALERLYGHLLSGTIGAARRIRPEILRLPEPAAATEFDDDASASAWLAAERSNLVATTLHCASEGPHRIAWRLADALRGYLYHGMHIVDWQAVAEAGLAAARADGDLAGQAAARISLALHHLTQGRHPEAIEGYREALSLARRAGWREAESAALGNLGSVLIGLGRFTEAAGYAEQALAIDRETGWLAGQASKLGNLAIVSLGLGRLELAASQQARALALYRRAGSRSGEARAMANLGEVRHALGHLDEAIGLLDRALSVHRELADQHTEGDTTRALAAAHLDAGRYGSAGELAGRAVELARRGGDRRLQAMALTTRAAVWRQRGELATAIDDCREALALARGTGDRYTETHALAALAGAHRRAGEPGTAADHAGRALALARQGEYRLLEKQILTELDEIGGW
jgi:DNA-binding SARP family transcriptional activator